MKILQYFFLASIAVAASACSDDEVPVISGSESTEIGTDKAGNGGDYRGFYVLNEGNMGSNKCTLDYFDYNTGNYIRNVYAENNPNQVLELGDVGNDLAIYNGRLYVVVNGSHKIEVLDAATAVRIGQVDINSPREIAFVGDKAYVTSYVGGDNDLGTVVRVDLNSLKVDGTTTVGYNPEAITLHEGKLFVANSYNYGVGKYDNTVSVLDPSTMKVDYTIATDGLNLQDIVADQFGQLWVSSLGNYADVAAKLIVLRKQEDGYYAQQGMSLLGNYNGLTFYNDRIYYYQTTYDANYNATYRYGAIRPSTELDNIGDSHFDIEDKEKIATPYFMTVNASTGDFFITDAKNYTSSGAIFCYDKDGKLKWSAKTGDIPGHIAFMPK